MKPLLAACRSQPVDRTPVWFMRQAGRSLPEYRALRERYGFRQMIEQPEVAAEVTLQPVRRLGVDAAILFSDIMTPVQPILDGLEVHTGVGPVLERPIRSKDDLTRLRPLEVEEDLAHVIETVRMVKAELPPEVTLIGFAGAPFTVASYLVEGGRSKEFSNTKSLMYSEPDLWDELTTRLAEISLASLLAQVAAGAEVVQLFDSWVGALSAADYLRYAQPASRLVLEGLAPLGVPRIHFGVGAAHLLPLMAGAGADVMGVDWRLPIDTARAMMDPGLAVQGNLDPTALLAPIEVLEDKVAEVLGANHGRPGHIFNLGWGVLPQTDPDRLRLVVDAVHSATLS